MSQVQQRVDYPFLRISHLPPGVENILSSDVPIATGRGTCPSENLGGIHVHFHSSFFLIFWCFSVRHSDFSFRAKRSCSPPPRLVSIDYLRRSSLRNPRSTKVAFPTGLASRAGSGVPVTASAASHAELALFQLLAALQISLDHLPSLILERVRGLESVSGIRPESASLAPFPHHHSAARCRRDDSFLRTRFRGRGGRGRPSSAHTPIHGLNSRSSRTPGSIHPSLEVMLLE